jgi:hypothetical protein
MVSDVALDGETKVALTVLEPLSFEGDRIVETAMRVASTGGERVGSSSPVMVDVDGTVRDHVTAPGRSAS